MSVYQSSAINKLMAQNKNYGFQPPICITALPRYGITDGLIIY